MPRAFRPCPPAPRTVLPRRLFASNSDAPSDQPPLRWAADAEGGAPYIFKDPSDINRYVGFEVELAAALGKELGRRIEFVQYDFKSLTPGLQRGDFDFAMNGVEDTPDRQKALRLSRPYYVYTLQLVARKDESRFASLEQCQQLQGVVGTMEDTAAERLLDKMGITKRGLRQSGRAVRGSEARPARCGAVGLADRHVLRVARRETENSWARRSRRATM